MIEELRKKLGNIVENSPTLLLGEAAKVFKENYTHSIIPLNIEEDLIDNHQFLVFDLSFFLRETPFISLFFRNLRTPTIILSSDNMVDPNMYPYFKNIIKYSTKSKSNLSDAITAQKIWREEINKSNIQNFYANESPEWYYLKRKFSMGKYVDLLSNNAN